VPLALPPLRTMLEAPAGEPWPVEATIASGPSRLTLAGGVRRDSGLAATTFAARPAPRGRSATRLIQPSPLPVATLRGMDAALTLSAATLRASGTDWRDASATVALAHGRLTIDPFVVTTPGGVVGGRLAIDAAGALPTAALRLESRGRGLDLVALRRAFGVPAGFEGQAEVVLDLRGQGATLQALAATASGEGGVAMVGGRFSGATALSVGPDLAPALFPRGTPQGGVGLRCVALRMSAEDGLAQSKALLAEGEFGRIDGSLAVNLRTEALAARLLPDVRLMGLAVRTPVTVGGTLAEPRVGVEPGAAVAQMVGDAVANRLWRSSAVAFLRGASGAAPPGGDCASALPLARLGRPGSIPAPAPVPIPLVPREVQGVAQDVVRGIGGLLGGFRR
jgi:uncharacterized protein involved in outer membrane biogenesis